MRVLAEVESKEIQEEVFDGADLARMVAGDSIEAAYKIGHGEITVKRILNDWEGERGGYLTQWVLASYVGSEDASLAINFSPFVDLRIVPDGILDNIKISINPEELKQRTIEEIKRYCSLSETEKTAYKDRLKPRSYKGVCGSRIYSG